MMMMMMMMMIIIIMMMIRQMAANAQHDNFNGIKPSSRQELYALYRVLSGFSLYP